jgi:hypothetical protein
MASDFDMILDSEREMRRDGAETRDRRPGPTDQVGTLIRAARTPRTAIWFRNVMVIAKYSLD